MNGVLGHLAAAHPPPLPLDPPLLRIKIIIDLSAGTEPGQRLLSVLFLAVYSGCRGFLTNIPCVTDNHANSDDLLNQREAGRIHGSRKGGSGALTPVFFKIKLPKIALIWPNNSVCNLKIIRAVPRTVFY